ncbi:hypothetical protein CF98_36425 [Halopseudomonas bauzanensis]|nr:hypothetical protein CF98_36425 [Halopseudomonas bauzanensis]
MPLNQFMDQPDDMGAKSADSSLTVILITLFGLGFCPQLIGLASDLMNTAYGMDSLRYALIAASLMNIWACFHYYLAGRTIKNTIRPISSPDTLPYRGNRPALLPFFLSCPSSQVISRYSPSHIVTADRLC